VVHSLHAYFLRRGDFNAPIVYEVDRALDGKHFSSRRVVAIQHGQQIFNMSASFQAAESGFDHQASQPPVPDPETLDSVDAHYRRLAADAPPAVRRLMEQKRPFEFRPVNPTDFFRKEKLPPLKYVWVRAIDALPDDEALHRCLLAYVSDFYLLDTALMPHAVSMASPRMVIASIDHAMWFHRRVRVDDWLLFATDSPSASGARGFTRGSVFARDGQLVASAAQEGLIRQRSLEPG
jgi:acyl-CoA thioesterase-2